MPFSFNFARFEKSDTECKPVVKMFQLHRQNMGLNALLRQFKNTDTSLTEARKLKHLMIGNVGIV
jgi:hypothetical protein